MKWCLKMQIEKLQEEWMVSVRELYLSHSNLLENNCLFVAHFKNNDTKSSEIRHDISSVDCTSNLYYRKVDF